VFLQPENQHVKFNVDVKVQNDPDRLFALMHTVIADSHPEWETLLAPRILIGLWHPCFIEHATKRLPYCRRSYIGNSVELARKYFWDECDTFSMSFGSLTVAEGQR
jgi:phosphatidylglycerol phospholipase C